MSSEYDFLDDFFSEGIIKASPPSSLCSDSKPIDSFVSPNLNSDQIDKLKRDNLKLRSRIKLYSKTLDQHKARLTQLLTEKLALREEQRKYADYGKKLEEATLCVEATIQLNKQLQELSKSHEKEKVEWEEKQTKLQENIKDLKKSLADCRRKEDGVKKRRKKYLKALVELSEKLMSIESFPKKYKRFYSTWKKQLEDAADDDSSFDIDDISEYPEKLSVSMEFLAPQSSTPKKLAHNDCAAATLATMSESEISEDDTAASPGKIKFPLPPREKPLKKLEDASLLSPSDKHASQETCVEKKLGRKVTRKGSKGGIQNGSDKTDSVGVKFIRSKTSNKSKDDEENINAVGEKSATENVCDFGEGVGSNNSSFLDVLEEKGLEIEKNLMDLEETAEKDKSDMQKSSDSASLQCIMDEMIVSLKILQPFDDTKPSNRKPEEETTCHQKVCSPPVNVHDLTAHDGTTEVIGNLSEDEDDNLNLMDGWGILPSVGKETVIEVTTGRKEVIQEKLLVGSESINSSLCAVNNIVSINCNSKITSDGIDNNFTSIRTSYKCSDKSYNPRLMDSLSVNEKDAKVTKKANEAYKFQTKTNSTCDIGRIVENNVDMNPPFSDLDHIPDSGFNSPESPIAEIGEPNVLFEKDHCSNSCVTETLRDLVSLRDSVLSLDDAITHQYSSEVTAIPEEVPKTLVEASGKGTPKKNCIEELISPFTQKAKKSPKDGKSPLKQACIVNEIQSSASKIRRSRRLMKEAKEEEESFSSVIKSRSQSRTRDVSMSPKAAEVKEVTSSPKVKNIRSDEMDVSGRRMRNKKGKTSEGEISSSGTSFQSLEGDDKAKALEIRVENLDTGSKEGEECPMLQKETETIVKCNNKETVVISTVSVTGKVGTATNDLYDPSSQVQSVGKTKLHSEETDSVVSTHEDEGLSVSDMAENYERMSEFGENTSFTSDDIALHLSEDDDDVDLQKSFGKNSLTSDGSQKCTNPSINGPLNSVTNDKVNTNSTNIVGSSNTQVLNNTRKEVNSGVIKEISSKRSDSQKECSNVNQEMDCQMNGVKTSGAESASLSTPSFNELDIECSTPLSKYLSIPRNLKQAFKLFLDILNPLRMSKTSIKNVSALTDSEMRKEDLNKNSADGIEEMNSDKDMSEHLQIFKEVEGDINSSIQYPLSAKHLSFLKKPHSYPMDVLVEESPKPKSTILVRCDYKSSRKCVNDIKSNDSSHMREDESMLMKTSNMHDCSCPCRFTVQKSLERHKETSVQEMKRTPSSAGKRKLNFNVIRRPIVPFFFGSRSLNTVFKVKFWIGGHFSSESYVDAYSCLKSTVVGFGHGDVKSPPKFSGVKYSKKGTLASVSYVDQYLLPTKPWLNLFSKKPKFSAFIAETSDTSSTDIHNRSIRKDMTEESKMKYSSQFVDQVSQESELHKKSINNVNFNTDFNAAAKENANCSVNGVEDFERSGSVNPANLMTSSIQENTCTTRGHEYVDRRETFNPENLMPLSIQENTKCAANEQEGLDRREYVNPANLKPSSIQENTNSAENEHESLDRSEIFNPAGLMPSSMQENLDCVENGLESLDGNKIFNPADLMPSSMGENTSCAANGHGSLDGSENENPAANVAVTAMLDDHSSSKLQSGDTKAVNFVPETQEKTNELTETQVNCSLIGSQSNDEENPKSPKELPRLDNETSSHGDTSFVTPSMSVMDTSAKEVNEYEDLRSDDTPLELSSPIRMEIIRHNSSNVNLSPASLDQDSKCEGSRVISKVEDQYSSFAVRKHRLPLIIQRKASVTPINRTKSCINTASGKVEKSEALKFSNNLASGGSSAMLADGRVDSHAILSKEGNCLSKRKLEDMGSNGEPLEKKAVSESREEFALPGSVDISLDSLHPNIKTSQITENSFKRIDTPKEIVQSASDLGIQSESDDGELMIELGPDNDDFIIDMGPQEVDEHLSEIGSSLSADALLDSGFLLQGNEKQNTNETIRSPTKVHKRRKLDNVGDERDKDSIHLSKDVPVKEKTDLKDSDTKVGTEEELYGNPPKKRRIAHSAKKNPVSKSSDSPSIGDDSAVGQPVTVRTNLNVSDSVSGVLLDNSLLILGEPEELLSKMFGSVEVHCQGFNQGSLTKTTRKPRKQTFNKIRKGANLKYTPPPEEVYRMLFGDIEDEDDKSEENDTKTFRDPDNLCGDLNDSMDKLYEKTKKIRIAHTPKTKPAVKKEVQSTPEESSSSSSKSHLPEIFKSLARKSIISHHNFNQKPKVRQSKLEKLRTQISKARGFFGRAAVDLKAPTTSNAKAEEIVTKLTTNKDAEEEKSDKSSKEEKMTMSKSASNMKGKALERIERENGISRNEDDPKVGQVPTNEASSNDESEEASEGEREMRKEVDRTKKGKRKPKKNDLSDKEMEGVTTEEEVDLKNKKSLITRKYVKKTYEKHNKQSNMKMSSVNLNSSDQESSSEVDTISSIKEKELISHKRGLKKKSAHEDDVRSTQSLESEQDVISPQKAVIKKTDSVKKAKASIEVHESENPDMSDSDSGRYKKLAPEDGEKSTNSSRSKQYVTYSRKALTKKTDDEKKRKASVEISDGESPEKSDLDSDRDGEKTSQPLLSSMSPKNVSSVSAMNVRAKTSSFSDDVALEKENVEKELDMFPAKSSEESKSNSVEGDMKESSEESFEGDGSSGCKDGTTSNKNKDNRQTEESLENMEVPPLSPLSSDELVDSFILCCDGDNGDWSPMKPKKDSVTGNMLKIPEGLAIPDTENSKTSSPGEGRAAVECEGIQPQERVKDLFFKIVQGRRKYFQNNQSDSNPDEKEALKCLLGRLHKKYYKTEDMDTLIEELNDETKNFKSKSVAKYLVRLLRKEDEDDVEHPVVRGAPRLSEMQLRVLTLILALDRRCPRFRDLIDIILKGISFLLFRLGHAPEVEVIMPLARIFTVICKIRKDLQTARTFCYDALFCLGLKAYALIFIVLSIWPEVFRKQDNGKDAGPLEISILIALMELRVSKKKGEIKVVPVQNILKNSYKFQQDSIKSDDFIKKLMLEMKDGKTMDGAEAATILLCKKKGWDWTHGNLLCQNLVSILEDYERGKISVNAAAFAVRLIGFISRSCSMETAGPVKPIVDYLYEAMKNQEKYPMAIQEAIAHSLICLSRFYIHRVAHALDIWTPPTMPSEALVKKMTNLVCNPHKRFWRRYFGQWRKKPKMPEDAVVACRPGVYYTDGDVKKILENGGEESMELGGVNESEAEHEGEDEGNEDSLKRNVGLKVRGGKAGHFGGGVRYRGGWKGSQAKEFRRNARWVGMLQRESSWIKEEEKKWDEIAWVKKVNIPSAERHDAEKLMTYEGNIFS